jgi:hypothetical protein
VPPEIPCEKAALVATIVRCANLQHRWPVKKSVTPFTTCADG